MFFGLFKSQKNQKRLTVTCTLCYGPHCVMLIAGSMFAQAEVPLDVLGVVAEFLAGAHCFGTLANLNIASHDLHDQTLPVL